MKDTDKRTKRFQLRMHRLSLNYPSFRKRNNWYWMKLPRLREFSKINLIMHQVSLILNSKMLKIS